MKYYSIIVIILAVFTSCSSENADEDRFVTKSGKQIVITPIKHASLQINYDGKEFEIDPVCSNVDPIVEYTDKPKADFILVTHCHDDHFDSYAIHVLMDIKKTNLIVNRRSYLRLKKKGIIMANGDNADLGDGIKLTAVPAYCISKNSKRIHAKGDGNGYILNLDGFRIYIAGDTELIPEMKHLGKIDVAFLPCNQPYTMNLKQLVEAAKTINPKVLYPYNWNHTSETDIRNATKNLKMDVRIRFFQ